MCARRYAGRMQIEFGNFHFLPGRNTNIFFIARYIMCLTNDELHKRSRCATRFFSFAHSLDSLAGSYDRLIESYNSSSRGDIPPCFLWSFREL